MGGLSLRTAVWLSRGWLTESKKQFGRNQSDSDGLEGFYMFSPSSEFFRYYKRHSCSCPTLISCTGGPIKISSQFCRQTKGRVKRKWRKQPNNKIRPESSSCYREARNHAQIENDEMILLIYPSSLLKYPIFDNRKISN